MGRHLPGTGRRLRAAAGYISRTLSRRLSRGLSLGLSLTLSRKLARLPRYWRLWVAGWGFASLLCMLLTAGTLALISPWGCSPKSQVAAPEYEPPAPLSQVIRVR